MQLFKHYFLFALFVIVLLAVPAGMVLLDAADGLREARSEEVLLARLRDASLLLRALREEQAASVRLYATGRAGKPELAALRERTDTAMSRSGGAARYGSGTADSAAVVKRVADAEAGLAHLRRTIDSGGADAADVLHGYRVYAEHVRAEHMPDGAGPHTVLAGPVGAWLTLSRGMDYVAQGRDMAWLNATGHGTAAYAAMGELCSLAARLDEQVQRQADWGLPPVLTATVATAALGASEPVLRRCAGSAATTSPRGDVTTQLDMLTAAEDQVMQWLGAAMQQRLLTAWAHGFVTVVTGGALLLLLSLYGFYLLRAYGRPLTGLVQTVRILREDAAAAARAEAIGEGDMALLAAAFNELVDARQEHEQHQRLSDSVFEHALDGILVTDTGGTIQAVNAALGEMLGYPGRTLMYRNVRLFKSGRHDADFYCAMWQAISERGAWRGEVWNRRSDGALVLMRLSIAAVRDAAGAVLRYIGIYSDVTEQRRAADELSRAHAYHRTVIAALGEGLYCVDGEGVLRFLNPAAERMLGWREGELLGRNAHDAFHDRRSDGTPLPRSECMLLGVFRDGIIYQGEEVFTRRDGSRFPVECHSTPLRENGVLTGAVVAFTDISRRKDDAQRIRHLAYHDSLTGLANRSFLLQHLRLLIAQGQRRTQPLAVLFLDLDRFKQVNDSLGHHIGDALLTAVAGRLRGVLREGDLLARQGGDEFIIVCTSPGDDNDGACPAATGVAAKIHAALSQPFLIEGKELYIGASIGISCLPEHGDDADTLLRHADQAMYQAKNAGVDTAIYAPGGDRNVQHRLGLETRLRGALARNDLLLLIQPVVELASGRIVGGEALLRWRDEGHIVLPDMFVPIAEETGQIISIGAWVNAEASRLAAQWRRQAPDFVLAVNLSPRQLFGRGLLRGLCDAMTAQQLERDALELEITETVAMALPRRARRSICWLRRHGVRISIDDFGTGHSSLARLQEITADRLKIDRSFVKGLPDTPHSVTIVRNTIALAHDLGMGVVAEGVETEAQRQLLLELGCDHAQGFLFSSPVEADQFTHLLAGGTLVPAES